MTDEDRRLLSVAVDHANSSLKWFSERGGQTHARIHPDMLAELRDCAVAVLSNNP